MKSYVFVNELPKNVQEELKQVVKDNTTKEEVNNTIEWLMDTTIENVTIIEEYEEVLKKHNII